VAAAGLQTPVGAVELPNGDLLVSNIVGGISWVLGGPRARSINSDLEIPARSSWGVGTDAAYVVDI